MTLLESRTKKELENYKENVRLHPEVQHPTTGIPEWQDKVEGKKL